MTKNLNRHDEIEKVLQENTLIVQFESKIIIKNNKQRLEFYLSEISNIRISKKRDLSPNITIFTLGCIFVIFIPINQNSTFNLITILSIFLFSTLSYLLKHYNYKLLINIGKYGFSEITLSKSDVKHAENFLNDFKIDITSKFCHEKAAHSKKKKRVLLFAD